MKCLGHCLNEYKDLYSAIRKSGYCLRLLRPERGSFENISGLTDLQADHLSTSQIDFLEIQKNNIGLHFTLPYLKRFSGILCVALSLYNYSILKREPLRSITRLLLDL